MFCIQPTHDILHNAGVIAQETAPARTQTHSGTRASSALDADSSISPVSPQWSYIGCFQENASRILQGATNDSQFKGLMNPLACFQHCEANGYVYAGIKYGRECWCGTSMHPNAPLLPETSCSATCLGKDIENCGGSWAISVYSRSRPHAQPLLPLYGSLAEFVAAERSRTA